MKTIPKIITDNIGEKELNVILNHYNEPHRFYHNFDHIISMFESVIEQEIEFKEKIIDTNLFLSILYHDIIYDPKRNDNEEKSVELFKQHINMGMVQIIPEEFRTSNKINHYPYDKDAICNAILETKTHKPTTELSRKLTMLDLEVLYSDYNTFVEYEDKIFKEYQFVDYNTYKEKRIEILKGFDVEQVYIDYVNNKKPKIAIYAGSFNPFTIAHKNIVDKASKIFDKVIIAKGRNDSKQINEEEFQTELNNLIKIYPEKEIISYSGLLTDLIKQKVIDITLVRGIRNAQDLDAENTLITYLKDMLPTLKVVYIPCDKEYEHISSTAIRNLKKYGYDIIKKYLP